MFDNILLIPNGIVCSFFFIYGSFLGSFANVLIYRQKEGKSLNLFKKSHCPQCFYTIPFYLNIPIFSWFILKGHCRNCGEAFSFRYPFVEFLMAIFFLFLFMAIGWKWFLLEALIFVFALTVASFIDWDQMILPDYLTVSGIILGLLGSWLNPERLFLEAFLAVLFGGGFLLLISYIYYWLRQKEGMGGGDIKMMAWIGAVLGWKSLSFVILSACLLGSLVGLGIMLRSNKKDLQTAFPFGPYLAISSLLYIFLNQWSKSFMDFFMPFFSVFVIRNFVNLTKIAVLRV